MFTSIRTTSENRKVITELTKRFGFRSENVVARIALAYSLANWPDLDRDQIGDSKGKEYSAQVLFGTHAATYAALIAFAHEVPLEDAEIGRLAKLHVDHGLKQIASSLAPDSNLDPWEFLLDITKAGLVNLEDQTSASG